MIQNNFAQDCNCDEVCTNATQNEKISMFPKFDDIPIFTNIKMTTSKQKGEGEWIHLVLLGMANRCQMGINGPPNVLLQKAFFSPQYFPYILSNIYIINLQKEYIQNKKLSLNEILGRENLFLGSLWHHWAWGGWLVCIVSKWEWQLGEPKLKCEHTGMSFDKSCRHNFPRFYHLCQF